jgi:O-antigen/teichoic acid export membrane protein
LFTGQAALKLAGAILLGLVLGPLGVIAGISIASVATYFVALHLVRRNLAIKANFPWLRQSAMYLAVIVPSTLCIAALLSTDVLLVKHFFPSRAAGEYAVVAALGRAIFWGASGVAAVLFPKVVFRTAQGAAASPVVAASLALVAVGGLAGLATLSIASTWLVNAFAGSAYGGSSTYLPWYALGMALMGGVTVLIATHQSSGRAAFLLVLIPLTVLEPVLLTMFHESLAQVVLIVDTSMAGLLSGLGGLYLIQPRAAKVGAGLATPDLLQAPAGANP